MLDHHPAPCKQTGRNTNVLSSETSRPTLGPSSLLFRAHRVLSPGVERLRRGYDHSPQSCASLRMSGVTPPLLLYASMACKGTALPLPYHDRKTCWEWILIFSPSNSSQSCFKTWRYVTSALLSHAKRGGGECLMDQLMQAAASMIEFY
jgi:hypothetical protein